jgi:dihydroneopterin aldolase
MHEVRLKIARPKALLFSRSVTLRRSMSLIAGRRSATGSRDWTAWHRTHDTISIDRLAVETVLGLNPHERVEKQRVETDLKLRLPLRQQLVNDERWGFDYKTFGKVAQEVRVEIVSKPLPSKLTAFLFLAVSTRVVVKDHRIAHSQSHPTPSQTYPNISTAHLSPAVVNISTLH